MTTTVAPIATTESVEAVYRQEGERLWRAVFAYTGDENVSSDAVAEAFAQVLRRGTSVRDVRRWVWRSAFRLAAGEMKAQAHLSYGDMPEPVMSDRRVDDALLVALQELTAQQRVVIVLYYYADCSVGEIGKRIGLNPLAVRAHLSRGRKRLRSLLGDDR